MSEAINPILQWLHANPHWAGLITFIISAAESVAVIGTIIPGSILMTAIGTLAGAGIIPFWSTIIWAIAGAIVGDGISYWLGYHFKDRMHSIWPFQKYPKMLENGERFFEKYGTMSVFIGRFVGPVRALVPLVAGMFGVKPLRFLIANVLSAIGWAPVYMFPGILLGAASLELPPDVTTHAFIMLLLVSLFVLLCIWLIFKFFLLIHLQIHQLLTLFWKKLENSSYLSIFTFLLRHHHKHKTHGQLVLAFYLILTFVSFVFLASYLMVVPPQDIALNKIFFHFFRGLRTPCLDNIMTSITLFGQSSIVIVLPIVLFIYFASQRKWYTATHILALGILIIGSIHFIKNWVHVIRPWGIANPSLEYSFPSGHSALSLAFFFGLALLFTQLTKIKYNRLFLSSFIIFILTIGISRLYLGMHWFTDVIGGWLLGACILMLIVMSYNRKKVSYAFKIKPLVFLIIITFSISYSIGFHRYFSTLQQNQQQIDWPSYTLTFEEWWNHSGLHIPSYRVNRFGLSQEVLNLQWIGSFEEIQQELLNNGWEIPPKRNWINVLQRIADVNSTENLPLVSPLYLDKKPLLVLIKRINNGKKLIVLRLWHSNQKIMGYTLPLWVGTVEMSPRTYSWLFKKKKYRIALTSDFLFKQKPGHLQINEIMINKEKQERSIVLIKAKE